MKISTSNRLYFLVSVFLIGFISLFTLNQVFLGLVHDLDKQTQNYKAKIKIGEYIDEDILQIKSLFFELATTTTSKRSRNIIENRIDDAISDIELSLNILANGGTLHRFIKLNIDGHTNTIKKITYNNIDKEKLSLEVIDIKPKLIELKNMLNEVNLLLSQRGLAKKTKNTKQFSIAAKKIRRFYKSTPSFFTRMSENIKRLLYEGDIELNNLKIVIENKKIQYMQIKMALILFVILIVVFIGYKINKVIINDNEEFQKAEASIRGILDTQPNIIIVSDGKKMIDANLALTEFFNQYKTLKEFKVEHECICDFFESNIENQDYISDKDYDGKTWINYILDNPRLPSKVMIKKDNKSYHFSILAKEKTIGHDGSSIIIISLNDITQVVEETKKSRDKDKQMMQQSRFAALGEMIGNIAHQWRQPLSAISSTSSSMKLQMQLGIASNEELDESYSKIIGYVEFLTQTIEDFRGFFKEDKELIDFDINAVINSTLSITSSTYKDKDIELNLDMSNKELISLGMPSELSQVFLNVLNNARDAIDEKKPEHRIVHLKSVKENNNNVIYIQDNAGGIPKKIIEKIFDPYFTTKHQAQGTGIGLYMSKDIIEKTLKGKISVHNEQITLNGKQYNGACFKITIPIKS